MTNQIYYVTPDEVRRLLGLSSDDISDTDTNELIKLAEDEVNYLTNSIYLVVQSTGTASSGANTTLTDSGKTWVADEWNSDANEVGGYMVYIYSGTGSGQCRVIIDNTTTELTVDSEWDTNPDNTSKYRIFINTYKNETFNGDGTTDYFVRFYPLLNIESITIDETDITIGSTYTYIDYNRGQIVLGRNAEIPVFKKEYPQMCNIKYYYGIYPIPILIKKLTAVTAGLMVGGYMVGSTYTFNTSYSLGDLSINKGVPYPHFEKILSTLTKQREFLITKIKSINTPAIG